MLKEEFRETLAKTGVNAVSVGVLKYYDVFIDFFSVVTG